MTTPGDSDLEDDTFLLESIAFPNHRLVARSEEFGSLQTVAGEWFHDALWVLKTDPLYLDVLYVENCQRAGWRMSQTGEGERDVGVVNGEYGEEQTWRFKRNGDGNYTITNVRYTGKSLCKWGAGAFEVGMRDSNDGDKTFQWKLTPRFVTNVLQRRVLATFDNSSGTSTMWKPVSCNRGVVVDANKIEPEQGFTSAMELSLVAAFKRGELTYYAFRQLKTEMWRVFQFPDDYSKWYEVVSSTVPVPPGKKVDVLQIAVRRGDGSGEVDDYELLAGYYLKETK